MSKVISKISNKLKLLKEKKLELVKVEIESSEFFNSGSLVSDLLDILCWLKLALKTTALCWAKLF